MHTEFGPDQAEIAIYSFKDGVMAAIGHDLRLTLDLFAIRVEGDRIEASFDATSIRTVCARKGRADAPAALSATDLRQIDDNTRIAVLAVERYPGATFVSTRIDKDDPEEWMITGQLSLHGMVKTISGPAVKVGGRRVARFTLHQPDFGIKPFAAFLGSLRVKPRVDVEISIPEPG